MPKTSMYYLLLAVLLTATWSAGQTTCSYFNATAPADIWTAANNLEHETGSHIAFGQLNGYCSYTDQPSTHVCAVACQGVPVSSGVNEPPNNGVLNTLIDSHYSASTTSTGMSASNGPGVSCAGNVAAEVDSCVSALTCNLSISISGAASGLNASVSFGKGELWTTSTSYPISCGAASTVSGCNPDHCGCGGSPIIIDTTGEGFQLTSEKDGVHFDIAGDGIKVQLSWTAAGSHNAFLALDRGNGITSGKDLFGNYTPQPKSDDPNGYLALAVFDLPENGGNGNGVIDPGDAVYSKLLLWIDENHDGIAQPNELHHLPELGVYSLSLKYADSPYTDEFGNQFRYKGKVNPLGQPLRDNVDRTSYDVFFVMGKVGGGTNGEVCSTGRPFRRKALAEWERQISEGPAPSSFPATKVPVLAANR